MFNLETADLYFPNTEAMRNYLEGLNYTITPRGGKWRESTEHNAICFCDWVVQLERLKQTNKLYYCIRKPTLTEEQSIFLFDILHLCPDYRTFKEALHQYINSNP